MTDDRYESEASEQPQARELAQARKFARIKAEDATREAAAYLPDPQADLDIEESVEVVDRFLGVRNANLGELAAPVSSLADDPHLVASAIDRCGGLPPGDEETSQDTLDAYQTMIAALVDLQAFVPDDDAVLVRHWDANRDHGQSAIGADEPVAAVLRRVRMAQAAAVKWVRDDPTVVGNLNAIDDLEIRIGDSRRAFKAVDAYRSGQTGGFSMMFIWPISAGIGALVGSIVFGPSLLVFAALAAAWLAAPAYGWAMGAVSSAVDQWVLGLGRASLVVPLRFVSTLAGAILLFGSPAIIAFGLLAFARRLELP